jgi:hypothetical protein
MGRSTECVLPTGGSSRQEFRFVSGELRLN